MERMIPQDFPKENMEQNPNSKDILSLDTPWDRWVHRPPARIIARVLAKTSIAPNAVTLTTLIPAFLAAWFFTRSTFVSGLWALFFFYLWSMLDHVDGELARLTKRASSIGQKLDDTCDDIASLIILTGIFFGISHLVEGKYCWAINLIFLAGLILNIVIGSLVLHAKRRVREEALKENKVTPRFVFFQKLMDHLTGRDPFYLLVLFVLWTFFWQGEWRRIAIGVLIGGMYFICLVSFIAWVKMTHKKSS